MKKDLAEQIINEGAIAGEDYLLSISRFMSNGMSDSWFKLKTGSRSRRLWTEEEIRSYVGRRHAKSKVEEVSMLVFRCVSPGAFPATGQNNVEVIQGIPVEDVSDDAKRAYLDHSD